MNADIYESAKVMFVFGKYPWFNNMVCDTIKDTVIEKDSGLGMTREYLDEFGVEPDESEDTEDNLSNSVDFDTFMDVIGVANINGKWYCKVDLSMLKAKQLEKLNKYIKSPSDNGRLVIVSEDWKDYRTYLNNKLLGFSKDVHLIQLSFPNKIVVKQLVNQYFTEKGLTVTSKEVDFFVIRMSSAYDEYEKTIDMILDKHGPGELELKDLKIYMKGIENYVLDDFLIELTKPLSSDKMNNKKVLRMLVALQDELGAKNLVYQLLKKVDECIEFRLLINKGYIPISLNYFFKDVIESLPNKEKYEKMNEWVFRRKADVASLTSLKDWQYIQLFLNKAIENNRVSDSIMDVKCKRVLYDIATRSIIAPSRINNIIGLDNVLDKDLKELDRIVYDDELLQQIYP